MFERYAIFYTPPSGGFASFGAAWLGWNSADGQPVTPLDLPDLDVIRLTARPRKYGFHATLKAPFHLASGQSPVEIKDAVKSFASTHAPVLLGPLEVTATNGFIALRPSTEAAALRALAADVVRDIDMFRAPLNADDIARRRKARLTSQQDQQMLDWGYPFIFDDFHFHMTLTGHLKYGAAQAMLPQIQALIAPILPAHPVMDAITLMGQDAGGMFHQIHRAALTG